MESQAGPLKRRLEQAGRRFRAMCGLTLAAVALVPAAHLVALRIGHR